MIPQQDAIPPSPSIFSRFIPATAGARLAFAVFVLAVLILTYRLGASAVEHAVYPGWIVFWCTAVAMLAIVPRFPAVGLGVFVLLEYGTPRYASEYDFLLSQNILNWVCGLTFVGWLMWMRHERRPLVLGDKVSIAMFAFVAWIFITLLVAYFSGTPWQPNSRHHPAQFAQALLMFLIASQFLGDKAASWKFALVLALALNLHALAEGSKVYLDGDVAMLMALALPLTVLGVWIAPHPALRVLFLGLALNMLHVIGLAQNRAAAVALAAVLLVLWWHSRHRWRILAVGLPLLVAATLFFAPQGYQDRFRAIWDAEASHSTAGLDRATVDERLVLWDAAWHMTRDAPWFGVGPGNYPLFVNIYAPGKQGLAAHNNFLGIATETGVPGVALYMLLFGGGWILLQRVIRKSPGAWPGSHARLLQASLAAYLVGGLFISRYDMVLAYLLLGWAVALAGNLPAGRAAGRPPTQRL